VEILDQLTTDKVQIRVVNKYETVSQELEEVKSEIASLKKTINPLEVNDIRKPRYHFEE